MSHPALSMLKVWAACILLYAVLPFHLVGRHLVVEGFIVLILFLGAFCAGTMLIQPAKRLPGGPQFIDFSSTEKWLAAAGVITIIAFLFDLREKSVLDLAEAYDLRSEQASALMEGSASSSTAAFQIGFLTYPAAYVYLVRAIIFERRIHVTRLTAFGALPVLMATAAMGGRAPLLYALLVSIFALGTRRVYMRRQYPGSKRPRRLGPLAIFAVSAIVFGALYYFVAVFFARAEGVGGAPGMFKIAEEIWGIGFNGPVADLIFRTFGDEVTYIIFIFNWYVVQGVVMSNSLFADYHGPMQFGVYGVDLVSALVRRLDGELVARNFDALQQLGTYGFLPSAFGSLFVDLWFFGILVSGAWGVLTGLVYQRLRSARDSRWLIFAPFVTMGILFSFINTPLGFSNGLVTHLWMLIAFIGSRRMKPRRPHVALSVGLP